MAVGKAIFRGELPPVTTLRCVDCDPVATAYDHFKGYARKHWLDVEPVCDSCNAKRARARPSSGGSHAGLLVRLPKQLINALDDDAVAECRSRNAQIEWILRGHCRERGLDIKEDTTTYVFEAA